MLNCNEVKDYVSDYFDNEINEDIKSLIEEHISTCKDCKAYFDEIKDVINRCRQITDEELPVNFKVNLHERLMKEAEKEKVQGRSLRNKYIAIFSSIAAGLILVFLFKGFYGNFNSKSKYQLSDNSSITETASTNRESKKNVASASIKNNMESTNINNSKSETIPDMSKNGTNADNAKDKNYVASANNERSVSKDSENKNIEESNNKTIGGTEKNTTQSQSKDYELAMAANESLDAIEENASLSITKSYTDPSKQKDRVLDAKLTIYTNDTENMSKKVQNLMQQYGGVFDSEDKVGNQGIQYENGKTILNILVPSGDSFENFWSDLKNTVGERNYGDEGRTEVDKNEDGMQDARALLNIQLESSQSEEEKVSIRAQLNKLDYLESYTCVTITIQQR